MHLAISYGPLNLYTKLNKVLYWVCSIVLCSLLQGALYPQAFCHLLQLSKSHYMLTVLGFQGMENTGQDWPLPKLFNTIINLEGFTTERLNWSSITENPT